MGPEPPKAVAGCEHVQRRWDMRTETFRATVLPGEFYVSCRGESITTVLGSCVATCLWDPRARVGGLNHFLLPKANAAMTANQDDRPTRYGMFAMEMLINTMMQNGASRDQLQAKIFGGGRVIESSMDIGQRNVAFVREYLEQEGLTIIGEDVLGPYARKLMFFSNDGRAFVKRHLISENTEVVSREREFMNKVDDEPEGGDVDLF